MVWLGQNRALNAGIAMNSLCSSGTSYFNTSLRVSMTCSSNSVSTYHIGYSIMLCQGVNVVLIVLAGDGACSCLVYKEKRVPGVESQQSTATTASLSL